MPRCLCSPERPMSSNFITPRLKEPKNIQIHIPDSRYTATATSSYSTSSSSRYKPTAIPACSCAIFLLCLQSPIGSSLFLPSFPSAAASFTDLACVLANTSSGPRSCSNWSVKVISGSRSAESVCRVRCAGVCWRSVIKEASRTVWRNVRTCK
jgi:hypothetical protein